MIFCMNKEGAVYPVSFIEGDIVISLLPPIFYHGHVTVREKI